MDTEGEYDNTDVIWSQTIFPALDTLNKLTSTPIYQKLAPYTNNDLFGEDPQNLHNIMKNPFEFYALKVKESTTVAIWKQIFIDAIQIIVSNKMPHSKKAHQIQILGIQLALSDPTVLFDAGTWSNFILCHVDST